MIFSKNFFNNLFTISYPIHCKNWKDCNTLECISEKRYEFSKLLKDFSMRIRD